MSAETSGFFETSITVLPAVASPHPIDRLHALLRELMEASGLETAVLGYFHGGKRRNIATCVSPRAFSTYPDDPAHNPFGHTNPVFCADVQSNPALHKAMRRISVNLASGGWHALVRLTFVIGPDERFSAVALGTKARAEFTASEIAAFERIDSEIRPYCMEVLPLLREFGSRPGFPVTAAYLAEYVTKQPDAYLLRDENMRAIAVSEGCETILGQPREKLLGAMPQDHWPVSATAWEALTRNAFEAGLTTPDLEYTLPVPGRPEPISLLIQGSPIITVDRSTPLLLVNYRYPPPRIAEGGNEPAPTGGGAAADFLFDTLVRNRSIRSRNDCAYITIRSWRSSIREHQIKALVALKAHDQKHFAARIAAEMHDEIERIAGFSAFSAIVPIPGGHSQPGKSLSHAIARALSALAGLPVLEAFAHQELSGSSHPKTNATRPPMILLNRVERPVLLIDDIATSGRHIEEAMGLLRQSCRSVLAVVWIGGEVGPPARPPRKRAS